MTKKIVRIIGGGTINYVRSHFAICAPAFGRTARVLKELCEKHSDKLDVHLDLTRMAGGHANLNTNEDVDHFISGFVADPATKIIFMPVALCDFNGQVGDVPSGKMAERLSSRHGSQTLILTPATKIIKKIREKRKDIFLVGFKHTTGYSEKEQYVAGLSLLKEASCNAVFANDIETRLNMIIVPEEARYSVSEDKDGGLRDLVRLAYQRSHLTFTRSTVVAGDPIPWDSPLVYPSLRTVVDYCIKAGAYKPFRGSTAGHFACKLDDRTFLTSIRKTDFNDLPKIGLVKVETDGPDSVIAYGSKPSVGGQSQRIVFSQHPEYDCIVHFHSPKRIGSAVPTISQFEYECGSHQCGSNTSRGLQKFGNLSAVYLDEHGPNIVFHHSIDPQEVINFIEANFNLEEKTGGYVSLGKILRTKDHLQDLRSYLGETNG